MVGSIFGIIKLLIVKLHDWLTGSVKFKLYGKPISEEVGIALNFQLARIFNENSSYAYIHSSDVAKLKLAIDKYFESEKK